MSSEIQYQIATIDLSNYSLEVDRGTKEWHSLCTRVRQACENNGFFEIVYYKLPLQLRADTFSMIKQVFALPLETKKKSCSSRIYAGYLGKSPKLPLWESFGLEDSSNYESLKSFTHLMWPNGHDQFCKTLISVVKKLDELKHMIEVMILDSYGLGDKSNLIMASATILRIVKYSSSPSGEYMQGLHAHTDKALSTILCSDQGSGLEVETKDGQWLKLSVSPTSLVFMVGDLLMAWSNGRMHAAKHRVMMIGDKDRYTLGQFVDPIEGSLIKPPMELVDEDHPRILKDLDYDEFTKFLKSEEGRAVDAHTQTLAFAGIDEHYKGTEKWLKLCKRVREACEDYGFFEVVYDKIPVEFRNEVFSVTEDFYSLPLETKKKNVNPKSFHGYYGQFPQAPLYESFAIEEASSYESLTSFTQQMWPNGHDKFGDTMVGMVNKMDELKKMIDLTIRDSYGLGGNPDSIMPSKTKIRVQKYSAPPEGEYMNGLNAHTDKQWTAILCDNQVSGLEFETKDKAQWLKLCLPPTSFVFIVGDSLMAWSNGRMHSVKHRVMMSGEKERFSFGVFAIPVEGTIIKAPKELVDEEHPQVFKEFEYVDFTKFSTSKETMAAMESAVHIWAFAGISSN